MAQRRRHLRRDALVFLGSLALHVGLFFIAAAEFNFYPPPPNLPAPLEVEIVPQAVPLPPPPPIPPIPKPEVQPTPQPRPSPPPIPQPQPKPQPAAETPAPQRLTQPKAVTATAPVKAAVNPSTVPSRTIAPAPTLLAEPTPAPEPGPPQALAHQQLQQTQPRAVPARQLILHKSQAPGSPLAPPVSIPGAIFAPSPAEQAAGAPSTGAAGGPAGGAGAPGGAGSLLGGQLPGFGRGLRGGPLGCANAAALKLTVQEQAYCQQMFGEGTRVAPQMSAIDASKRVVLDAQAAQEAAASKYRDSTPSGSEARPVAGQPRILTTPGQ